ncbi:hyaluronidase-3 isoform X1 [Paramormyrops kingsleyae]|uniref:hyaluronidase-3 isoform X1 n=2 Tax=Paramormyrops kingsleyae TaxID=1676925 RepID=UPI003B96FACD
MSLGRTVQHANRLLGQSAIMVMIRSPLVLHILGQLLFCSGIVWAFPGTRTESHATADPRLDARPFTVVWNMPTAKCQEKYGVHLDLSAFDIIANHHEKFQGQNMTVFYYNKLGLYPYISKEGDQVNGGVPQQSNLQAHLSKAKAEIEDLLKPGFHGLAVIDWEKWHPLWVRNFGAKKKYKLLSEQLVMEEHPDISRREVLFLACREFERSAKQFMSGTLQLGADTRPAGLWGFYGFPACYNYHKGQHSLNYTGHCHPKAMEWNSRLDWLWNHSNALYPSIYLPLQLAGSPNSTLMVRYRILEALRVASYYSISPKAKPVLPYARVAFVHTLRFLNKIDLDHTLGEAAALGAAGVVLWGELRFAKSKHQCQLLKNYVDQVLGKFVQNLKHAAWHCSDRLCSGKGRCTRRDPLSGHTLHQPDAHPSSVSGRLPANSTQLGLAFRCVCYRGWTGEQCQERML